MVGCWFHAPERGFPSALFVVPRPSAAASMMAFSSSRTLSYSTQVSRTRGRPNGSSTGLYETRGKRRQKVFSQGMELAATACEQGNTTVLTITSDHLTGNFLRVPHNGAGRPRIGLFIKPTGGFPFSSAKQSPKASSLAIEFLAKLGRPRVSSENLRFQVLVFRSCQSVALAFAF